MTFAERRLESDSFRIRVWSPAPHILCSQASGRLRLPCVPIMLETFDLAAAATTRPISIFQEWYDVTGYDSDARAAFVEGSKGQMERIDRIWYLTSSSIVTMAVSVANIVLGGKLHATTDRRVFERELAAAQA